MTTNATYNESQLVDGDNSTTSDQMEQNSAMTISNSEWSRPKAVDRITPNELGRISEVMIMDVQYGVLVHKRSLHNIPYRKAQQLFAKKMRLHGQKNLKPYFREDGVDIFYLSKNDVYLVAAHASTDTTDSALSLVIYLDILHRFYQVLKDCLGTVSEAYVTVNQMLVFEILDEMLNQGYCHVSSYKEVKPHLSFEPIRPKIVQDDIATRFFGINIADKSRQQANSSEAKMKSPNSAYINIIEGLSAVLGPNGEVRTSELWGKMSVISTLTRPSPILIDLSPDLVLKDTADEKGQVAGAVHVENPSFHPCVDTSLLKERKTLRILPPSDQTRLMVYTLSDSACIRIPVVILPSLTSIENSRDKTLSLRLMNQAEAQTKASYVRVKVQLPRLVQSVATNKSGSRQSSQFNSEDNTIDWEIRKSPGGSEDFISYRLILPSPTPLELADIGPISVSFNVTNFSASGLLVKMARVESTAGGARAEQTASGDVGAADLPECFFGVSTKAVSFTIRTDSVDKS